MNTNKILHIHLSLAEEEVTALKKYCKENGIIVSQLTRRLLMQEIKEKSTLLSPDYIPPKILESLVANKR